MEGTIMDKARFEEEINFIAQKGQEFRNEIQSWRQDFLGWIAAVKEEYMRKKNSQSSGSSVFVPPTPAACVKRKRPKLSVVKEQEDEEDTEKPFSEEAAPGAGAVERKAAENKADSPERRPVRRAARQASTRIRSQSSVVSKKSILDISSVEDSDDDRPLRVTRASKRISAKRRNTGANTRGSKRANNISLQKKRNTAQKDDQNSSEAGQEGGTAEEQRETQVERSSVKRALADDGSSDVQSEDLTTTNRNSRKKTKSLDDSEIKVVRKSSHKIALLEASSLEEDDLVATTAANPMNATQVLSSERGSAGEEPVEMEAEVDKEDRGAVGDRASAVAESTSAEDVGLAVQTNNAPREGSMKEKDQRPKASVLFSPYNNDPVKKRVAAYETLKPVTEEPEKVSPVRMTRTKTRAKAAAAAAAAALAAVAEEGDDKQKEKQLVRKSARKSLTRAKKQLLLKLHKPLLVEGDSKENSERCVSKYPVISLKKTNRTPLTASKILMDLNGQSTNKANSRTTPLNTSKPQVNALSTSYVNRNITKPGVIVSNMETFITKAPKVVLNVEAKKKEDLKKWKEKEEEAQRKKEEHLKMRAEQSKKQEEKRLKVLQNREAQEREKQAALLRLGQEKDEKAKQAIREREARQREEAMKRKQQGLQKAAEAEERRRQEEAARQAKQNSEEEQAQLRREQEEAERAERQRQRAEDEKALAAALQREKAELLAKEKAKEKKQKKVATQQAPKDLNSTWVRPEDTGEYDLGEISCDSTDDEAAPKKKIAPWAKKQALIETGKSASLVPSTVACAFFQSQTVNPDMSKMFRGYKCKRASSQFWKTPPRYSQMPKY